MALEFCTCTGSPFTREPRSMKTPIGTHKYLVLVLGVLGCGLVISNAQQPTPTGTAAGKVKIYSDGIVIHPGVKLSPNDEQSLADALKKFDKSLYKIQTLENGQVKKSEGTLSDEKISKALKSEMADARAKRLSGFEVEFVPGWVATKNEAATAESKELIEKIKPILQKYQ